MGFVTLLAAGLLAAEPGVEPLHMVLTPYRAPEELLARYRPLADRLGAAAGRPVELKVAPDLPVSRPAIVCASAAASPAFPPSTRLVRKTSLPTTTGAEVARLLTADRTAPSFRANL